jgi:hypothetical protein
LIHWLKTAIDLVKELNPWICLSLFLFYGLAFESLYVLYISYLRDFRRIAAANAGTILFLLSLWGLGEAFKNNIMYAIPIAAGTWAGNFIQVTLERRKSEKNDQGGDGTSCEEEE